MIRIALHGLLAACLFGIALDMARATLPLPQHLHDTGLYAPGSKTAVRSENLSFSPQYPLWSDGTRKRRWLYLPAGTAIDAANANAWVFPPGTRLWKEFSYGQALETRYIERLRDGTWRYATYVWNAEGSDAVLAPAEGIAALPLKDAPGGRYAIPSRDDCRACHESAAAPVLGVSALQLSPDRDPLAPHAEPAAASHTDLPKLAARGLLRNFPAALFDTPPRIAGTPVARAALGYLHGNCGHCHNDSGPLDSLELSLAQEVPGDASPTRTLRSTLGQLSRYRPRGAQPVTQRIVPGAPHASVLALRMRSRNPLNQMPPLGTQLADAEGLALIERWIQNDLPLTNRQEILP